MIRHDQFVQSIDALGMMYEMCGSNARQRGARHPHWHAIYLEGPLDQLCTIRAEMHEYLNLPEELPEVPLSAEEDAVPAIASPEAFQLALEQLRRLYHALGAIRMDLGQYRPRLYGLLRQQFIPQLVALEAAFRVYLGVDEVEQTLTELDHLSRSNGPVALAPEGHVPSVVPK